MSKIDYRLSGVKFVKSSASMSGNCVAVGRGRDCIGIQDTKGLTGHTLTFTPAAYNSFLHDLRKGTLVP
jgi:hypothetical protein